MARYNFIDKTTQKISFQIRKSYYVVNGEKRNKTFFSKSFSFLVKDNVLRNEPSYNGSYGVVSKKILHTAHILNYQKTISNKNYIDSSYVLYVPSNENITLSYDQTTNNLYQINTTSTAGNTNKNPDTSSTGTLKEFWA